VVVDTTYLAFPKHVTEEIDLLSRALGSAYRIFVFSDYGGTLVPETSSGCEEPSSPLLSRLEKLSNVDSFSIFVMSGKTVEELDGALGLDGIGLVGQSGFEIRKPGGEILHPVDVGTARGLLQRLELEAHGCLDDYPGVVVYNKGFSVVAEHGACSREDVRAVTRRFSDLARRLDGHGQLELIYRASALEARVAGWCKGDAIKHLLRDVSVDDTLAIYIGNDVTDEEAFEALLDWSDEGAAGSVWMMGDPEADDEPVPSALPILVSPTPRPTRATLFVRGPHEVYEFLSSMTAIATALL